ncbi:nucleoside-diphosphate kinase [Lacticaseibacillus saniviri]
MTEERILMLVKPDGVADHHVGEIISRVERRGYVLEALKVVQATPEQLEQHYHKLVDEPFFSDISEYMLSGPIVAMIASGTNIIKAVRTMTGNTNPTEAASGTIRGDFAREWSEGAIHNVVHSSDSVTSAEREIGIWFPERNA